MLRKIIEMLASAQTDHAQYNAGEIYAVPPAIAERFVRERVAKYVGVDDDDDEQDEPRPEPGSRSGSQTPWRQTVRPGDTFRWQITLNLDPFEKARILPELQLDEDGAELFDAHESAGISEIGGDGEKPSAEQASAIDYLAQHAAHLYPALLDALADYAKTFRPDWASHSPALADKILPRRLGPTEIEQRVAFSRVYLSTRFRDRIAYVVVSGDCVWDPGHGFVIILHQDRIVDVTQQGTGWSDPAP